MGTVKTVAPKCPYITTREVAPDTIITVEERWDFQIGENGQVERISLGEFDLLKEVDSHKGEVGLLNCLKLAEARGVSLDTFAKKEDGLMADVGDINTLDDLINAKAAADAKLKAIADQYGLTVAQLTEVLKTGVLPEKKESSEGEENA